MKGNPKVIDVLNQALTEELTAINQYFIHGEIYENLGFEALHHATKKDSIEEMKHAEKIIERLLFLEGQPNMSRYNEIKVGSKVEEMLANDLAAEKAAVASYNHAIEVCRQAGDNVSRDLFLSLLREEEGHVDWLETQLSIISQIGIANYLTRQVEAKGK